MENNNKDYILNIRVSKETYKKVKDMAKDNSESVSALIRKVLKDSEEILGDIFPHKSGWDSIKTFSTEKAARDIVCEKTGKKVKKGSPVVVGQTSSGKRYYFAPGHEPR